MLWHSHLLVFLIIAEIWDCLKSYHSSHKVKQHQKQNTNVCAYHLEQMNPSQNQRTRMAHFTGSAFSTISLAKILANKKVYFELVLSFLQIKNSHQRVFPLALEILVSLQALLYQEL